MGRITKEHIKTREKVFVAITWTHLRRWVSEEFIARSERWKATVGDVSVDICSMDDDCDTACIYAPVRFGGTCTVVRVWISSYEMNLYKYSCSCEECEDDGKFCTHCCAVLLKAIDKYRKKYPNLASGVDFQRPGVVEETVDGDAVMQEDAGQ